MAMLLIAEQLMRRRRSGLRRRLQRSNGGGGRLRIRSDWVAGYKARRCLAEGRVQPFPSRPFGNFARLLAVVPFVRRESPLSLRNCRGPEMLCSGQSKEMSRPSDPAGRTRTGCPASPQIGLHADLDHYNADGRSKRISWNRCPGTRPTRSAWPSSLLPAKLQGLVPMLGADGSVAPQPPARQLRECLMGAPSGHLLSTQHRGDNSKHSRPCARSGARATALRVWRRSRERAGFIVLKTLVGTGYSLCPVP